MELVLIGGQQFLVLYLLWVIFGVTCKDYAAAKVEIADEQQLNEQMQGEGSLTTSAEDLARIEANTKRAFEFFDVRSLSIIIKTIQLKAEFPMALVGRRTAVDLQLYTRFRTAWVCSVSNSVRTYERPSLLCKRDIIIPKKNKHYNRPNRIVVDPDNGVGRVCGNGCGSTEEMSGHARIGQELLDEFCNIFDISLDEKDDETGIDATTFTKSLLKQRMGDISFSKYGWDMRYIRQKQAALSIRHPLWLTACLSEVV